MSTSENMCNFTALYTSHLHFSFATISMHATPRACGILVFFPAFFYKFILFEFCVKDTAGTIDHASRGPVEAYTCRSKSTFSLIIWVCKLDFEKFH